MLRHRRLACSAIIASASLAVALAQAAAEPRATLELFTSQGCSSCPAADRLLGELAKDPTLVAISLPIDYWDYIGWKDTLADRKFSTRQRAYAQMLGARGIYTPQVVVNGLAHVVGSDRAAIERAIVQTRQQSTTLSIPVTMKVVDGHLVVTVAAAKTASPAGDIWLGTVAKAVTVDIRRGENRGKTITYHHVVRHWHKIGDWTGKDNVLRVPLRELKGDKIDSAVVFVQAGPGERPGAIFGAAFASLH
jgi:hypothetical protein